jgi:hypothetical protein
VTRRRLRLLLPAAGLFALVATAAGEPPAVETAPPPRPAAEKAAPADGARPRLATWRESARPPAEVPPTALVRAAKRKGTPGAARTRGGPQAARPEPVEIIWHAPGS